MAQEEKEEEEEKKQVRNDGIVEDVSGMPNFAYTGVPGENGENGKFLNANKRLQKMEGPLEHREGRMNKKTPIQTCSCETPECQGERFQKPLKIKLATLAKE